MNVKLACFASTLFVWLSSSACIGVARDRVAEPPTSAPVASVKIASSPTAPGVLPVLAAHKGYFRDAGVEVQLETLGGPQDATVLIATGRLDAAVVGFTAATFNAIDHGLDIKIVASFGGVTPDYRPALMVRRDLLDSGEVTTLADLRGRRVASLGGASSAATYQITRALRDVGLDARDVELVNLSLADTVAAFSSRAIDAAYLPVPFSAQAEQLRVAGPLGGVHTDGAGPLTVGLLFRGEFARVSPGAARATMVALVRAARDLRGDGFKKAENLAILSAHTRLPEPAVEASGPIDFDPDLRPDSDILLDMQRVFMELGVLSYSTPMPIERIADPSFSDYVVQTLGPQRP
jgi:NitT/TauT family transport system substrate-binding protein